MREAPRGGRRPELDVTSELVKPVSPRAPTRAKESATGPDALAEPTDPLAVGVEAAADDADDLDFCTTFVILSLLLNKP
jgi:hypothetical protein